jgi:esterase/lipase
MSYNNSKLFEDPHSIYPTVMAEQDFLRYISECKTLIETTRQDLATNPEAAKIIEANCPYELNPTGTPRGAALLLHGLYDSPFIMKDIAEHLQKSGLKIRSLLLPGHGSVPGALLNVRYQEWLDTVEHGLKGLAKEFKKIWLIGFSTGGTLALYHALKKTLPAVAGVVLLAPAIKISALSNITHIPPKLGIAWYHKDHELDYSKYESFTFNSIYQLHLLINDIKQLSKTKLDCPLLMILSADDRTVNCSAAIDFFQKYASSDSQLILYRSPSYAAKRNTGNLADTVLRKTTFDSLHIRGISHISIPVAPDNMHYGQHGDYIYASRIDAAADIIYIGDNTPTDIAKNYLHKYGLYPHQFARLTYNPDFEFLKNSISQFVDK